ncbi:hypothetical protein HYU13_04065 [Candidatus Woesearchaeota archaeon]|nr:hypothetical protein [Candidatus Woesearchaeota archaeon]
MVSTLLKLSSKTSASVRRFLSAISFLQGAFRRFSVKAKTMTTFFPDGTPETQNHGVLRVVTSGGSVVDVVGIEVIQRGAKKMNLSPCSNSREGQDFDLALAIM